LEGEGEAAAAAPALWVPAPGGTIRRGAPSRIGFELYSVQPDESGTVRYEVEERVLTLQLV
jgi:hypothetical protein